VYSRFRHSFYALLLLGLFSVLVMMTRGAAQSVRAVEGVPLPQPQRAVVVAVAVVRAEVTVQQ